MNFHLIRKPTAKDVTANVFFDLIAFICRAHITCRFNVNKLATLANIHTEVTLPLLIDNNYYCEDTFKTILLLI